LSIPISLMAVTVSFTVFHTAVELADVDKITSGGITFGTGSFSSLHEERRKTVEMANTNCAFRKMLFIFSIGLIKINATINGVS
jgi:hypothetical protein